MVVLGRLFNYVSIFLFFSLLLFSNGLFSPTLEAARDRGKKKTFGKRFNQDPISLFMNLPVQSELFNKRDISLA